MNLQDTTHALCKYHNIFKRTHTRPVYERLAYIKLNFLYINYLVFFENIVPLKNEDINQKHLAYNHKTAPFIHNEKFLMAFFDLRESKFLMCF